jgi:hypothetical protein
MKQRPSLAANLRGVGTAALLLAPGFIVLAIRSGTRWVAFCLLFIVVCRLLFWILAPYSSTARKVAESDASTEVERLRAGNEAAERLPIFGSFIRVMNGSWRRQRKPEAPDKHNTG